MDQIREVIAAVNSLSPSPLTVVALALLLAIIVVIKM